MNSKKTPNANPPGLEAILHLIPANALAEDLVMVISGDYLKMRYETAIAMKTGNATLAAKEHERFMENCRIIKAVSLGIELRNYLLWEVYSTGQFRDTHQDFEALGMRLTELSKPQLRKCVHAGRIRMEMIHAGLDDVRPTGRQVEELSKVEESHTVAAWLYTLDFMRDHGRSDAIAREALLDYCKVNEIPFGRRSPNGSRKLGLSKVSRKGKKTKSKRHAETELEPKGNDWELSAREEETLLWLDPVTMGSDEPSGHDERVSRCIAALRAAATTRTLSDYQANRMQALLAMVARKDEETARSLLVVAWEKLRDVLTEKLLGDATLKTGTSESQPHFKTKD
jgi:hypothetical protein